jgi:putative restriction endonuclease
MPPVRGDVWQALVVNWTSERDLRLRREAMAWLTVRTNDGLDSIRSEDLRDFTFEGERIPLIDAQRGIRKPAVLDAALSIRTVYRPEGATRPYEDTAGLDGFIRYKWRGADGDHPENRALRATMRDKLPLIWFFGVGPGVYQPIFPIYLIREEPREQQFVVAQENTLDLAAEGPLEEQLKRYVIRETKQRLHQPVFRATVMRAYETRCAVCSLRHTELLDAAHIVPDSDEAGVASVRNGIALCKIHHAAFDAKILGIRPDKVVQIRADLLDEVDGPMLQYGLKERHNQALMALPRARREQPDPELLEIEYQRFLHAS